MATGITYSTTGRKRDLRTVIVNEVRSTVVLLPTGSLDVVVAKLLEGTASRHQFWAEELGTDPADHTFIVPADQIIARREIIVSAIFKHRRAEHDGQSLSDRHHRPAGLPAR